MPVVAALKRLVSRLRGGGEERHAEEQVCQHEWVPDKPAAWCSIYCDVCGKVLKRCYFVRCKRCGIYDVRSERAEPYHRVTTVDCGVYGSCAELRMCSRCYKVFREVVEEALERLTRAGRIAEFSAPEAEPVYFNAIEAAEAFIKELAVFISRPSEGGIRSGVGKRYGVKLYAVLRDGGKTVKVFIPYEALAREAEKRVKASQRSA